MAHNDGWKPSDVRKVVMNPIYVVGKQAPPLVDKDTWIRANTRLIAEIGVEQYLRELLAVLAENDAAR